MFEFFHRRGRKARSKDGAVTKREASDEPISRDAIINAPVFDPIKWALANPWLVDGQANDRMPVNGAVADSGGTSAERRSFARRSHQLMFKKWSQDRHD